MKAWIEPEPSNWWNTADDALREDLGHGDVTAGCLDPDAMVNWMIEAQADGVLCGVGIAEYLLAPYPGDPDKADVEILSSDGDAVTRGTVVLRGVNFGRRVMAAERTALNFLMHLSGVATLTRSFVDRVASTPAKIVDTRKTIPGLRLLQKYAVRCGGGANHRMGLYDAAMIKDNHIRAAGGISKALDAVRSYASHLTRIEVECETLEQVAEAVEHGADVVLLDNMDPFMMREAVRNFGGKCVFEASGGISLETVRGVAQTGVQYISVGALTHSAVAVPFHLELT